MILLRRNTTRNSLVLGDTPQQPFDLARHVFYRVSERPIPPTWTHLIEGRSIGPGLVNLPDHSIRSLANVEVEADLCLPRAIADDGVVAGHLARSHPSA